MRRLSGDRAACACAAFPALRAFVEPRVLILPDPAAEGQNHGGGEDYPPPPAFPGAAAPCAAFSRPALRACVEPLFRFSSSRPATEGYKTMVEGEDSNLRRLSRQIYSLIPLTAREPSKRGGILWQGRTLSTGHIDGVR